MLNYNQIYSFSDPIGNRPYRGEINDFELAEAEVSRGETRIDNIVDVNHAMGESNPKDIIWTTNAFPLIVSERVIGILNQNKITGWEQYDVRIYNKQKELIKEKFVGIIIIGRCGFIDYSRGYLITKKVGITDSEHIKAPKFNKDFWDGSDLFMHNKNPEGKITMHRYCTKKVVDIFKKEKVRNIEFEKTIEIANPIYMLEIGASDREKKEIEQLSGKASR